MARISPASSWELNVDLNLIDVTSQFPSANEQWTFTDAQGHEHRYEYGYPTLDVVVDAEHWCDGTEGTAPHDPHMAVDESHYECKLCREVIVPAMDPPYTPKSIPGQMSATLRGMTSDGREVTMWLEPLEVDIIQQGDDETAQRYLDGAPRSRILSETFAPR